MKTEPTKYLGRLSFRNRDLNKLSSELSARGYETTMKHGNVVHCSMPLLLLPGKRIESSGEYIKCQLTSEGAAVFYNKQLLTARDKQLLNFVKSNYRVPEGIGFYISLLIGLGTISYLILQYLPK